MYRVCIPLFSRCVFLTRIPWQLFSDEQSRRSPGRVWSGIWNPISSHWHLDPYNCRLYNRLYIIYRLYIYIYCYIIVVASQGSDGSILEKPEQDDCGKLCRTSVSAEPVRIKLEKRIYNISQTQTATGGHVQMSAGNKWANCWFRLGSTRIAWKGTGSSLEMQVAGWVASHFAFMEVYWIILCVPYLQ